MILINNFAIINNGTQITIDVETNVGSHITSISFWTMNDFKDSSKSKNLSTHIVGTSNRESFTVNASELSLYKFEDICFIEVGSNYVNSAECVDANTKVTGVTYNLSQYYACLFNYLSEISTNACVDCGNDNSKDTVITINMLIDTIVKSVEIGYYSQGIDLLKKLKKICSIKTCLNCPTIDCPSCSGFTQI